MVEQQTTSTFRAVTLAAALIGVLVGLPLALRVAGDGVAPSGLRDSDAGAVLVESSPGGADIGDPSSELPAFADIVDGQQTYERPTPGDLSDRARRVVDALGAEFTPVAEYERLPDWGDSEALAFEPHLPGRYVSIGWFEGRPETPPTLGAPRDAIVQVDGVDVVVVRDFVGVSLGFRIGTTDVLFVVEATVPMVRVEEAEQAEIADWMLSVVGGLMSALAADA